MKVDAEESLIWIFPYLISYEIFGGFMKCPSCKRFVGFSAALLSLGAMSGDLTKCGRCGVGLSRDQTRDLVLVSISLAVWAFFQLSFKGLGNIELKVYSIVSTVIAFIILEVFFGRFFVGGK